MCVVHLRAHTHTHTGTHRHIHAHTHAHARTHTHTHTHTHIHTHTGGDGFHTQEGGGKRAQAEEGAKGRSWALCGQTKGAGAFSRLLANLNYKSSFSYILLLLKNLLGSCRLQLSKNTKDALVVLIVNHLIWKIYNFTHKQRLCLECGCDKVTDIKRLYNDKLYYIVRS